MIDASESVRNVPAICRASKVLYYGVSRFERKRCKGQQLKGMFWMCPRSTVAGGGKTRKLFGFQRCQNGFRVCTHPVLRMPGRTCQHWQKCQRVIVHGPTIFQMSFNQAFHSMRGDLRGTC